MGENGDGKDKMKLKPKDRVSAIIEEIKHRESCIGPLKLHGSFLSL